MNNLIEGEDLEVKVSRTNDQGVDQEKLLTAKIRKVTRMGAAKLSIDENATKEMVTLRETWLGVK